MKRNIFFCVTCFDRFLDWEVLRYEYKNILIRKEAKGMPRRTSKQIYTQIHRA